MAASVVEDIWHQLNHFKKANEDEKRMNDSLICSFRPQFFGFDFQSVSMIAFKFLL